MDKSKKKPLLGLGSPGVMHVVALRLAPPPRLGAWLRHSAHVPWQAPRRVAVRRSRSGVASTPMRLAPGELHLYLLTPPQELHPAALEVRAPSLASVFRVG
jgi:hypothetical protein